MMKLQNFLLSSLFVFSCLMSASDGVYSNELKALKQRPDTKILLDDKNAHQWLRSIQADTLEYKSSSLMQRFSRFFLSFDLLKNGLVQFNFFVVTPETMPMLHHYVEKVCKKAGIRVPAIYITRSNWIPNAVAVKLLMSSGIIIISKKLVKELSDEALEGVITHEIGHIKHNHINKKIAVAIGSKYLCEFAFNKALAKTYLFAGYSYALVKNMYKVSIFLLPKLIEGKRFEKQADTFAFEYGKAKGIIDYIKYMEAREQVREDEFAMTYEILKKHRKNLFLLDYCWLKSQYWLARGLHKGRQGLEWIYVNTILDPHPTNQSRIDAAEKYLAQQQA